MPRDSQRSKVYRAGWAVFAAEHGWGIEPQLTLDECQEYVDKVTGSKWWAKRARRHGWRTGPVVVTPGHGQRRALYKRRWPHPQIGLPRWSRNHAVILHELAHHATSFDHASHGREFCRNFIRLVQRWMGVDVAKALKAAFDETGAKWRKKRRTAGTPRPTPPRCPTCNLFMGKDGCKRCGGE